MESPGVSHELSCAYAHLCCHMAYASGKNTLQAAGAPILQAMLKARQANESNTQLLAGRRMAGASRPWDAGLAPLLCVTVLEEQHGFILFTTQTNK